jgi:hypothetical protein
MPTGGGGGSQTVTQKSDPWSGQQPSLLKQFEEANRLFDTKTTPQYNMEGYNTALHNWETANSGQTPQYDNNAYQQALKTYNTQTAAAVKPTLNAWETQQGLVAGAKKNKDLYEAAMANFTGKAPSGPAPTLEQFMLPSNAGAKPKLDDFITSGGQSLLAPQVYPGSTIAAQSPESLQALEMQKQRALSGSPITNTAKDYTQGLLSGDYLNSNPYLDATFNKAADQVQGRVNSAFGAGGRFGSGINQEVLGKSLGDLATGIYGGNYDQERNRQQQGLLFAPTLANQDYYDIGQLSGVGDVKTGRAQDLLNEQISKFNTQSQSPALALQNFANLINGNYGGSSSTSTPYYQNNTANTLGLLGGLGGLAGAGSGGGGLLGGLAGLASGGLGGGPLNPLALFGGLPWSDSRLKHNINFIENIDGVNLYSFKYMPYVDPDQSTYVGVMAEELLLTHPKAVHMKDGWLAVDYSQLPVTFQRVH